MLKKIFSYVIIVCLLIISAGSSQGYVYANSQQTKFKMAITTGSKVMAVKTDGTLWEWYYPKTTYQSLKTVSFKKVNGVSNVKSVASNEYFTVVLKNDGTVWGWGKNDQGQLGDGTFVKRTNPVKTKNISKVKDIVIFDNHAMALKSDGTVWVWGDAGYGTKYANGAINTPVKVKELSNIKSVAAGDRIFEALKGDGTVWAWGWGDDAQLGYKNPSTVPKKVPDLKNIISLSANRGNSIALGSNGNVYVWGNDYYINQLYNDYSSYSTKKYQVKGLTNVSKVYAGDSGTFVIKKDGTVSGWGDNIGCNSGGTNADPVKVSNINKVIQISNDYFHTVFTKSDGTIWICGYKCDGFTDYIEKSPIAVKGLKDVKEIAASDSLSAALKNDGTVWMWGGCDFGSTNEKYSLPKQVKGLDNVKSIQAGYNFYTALKFDGTVWAWGYNEQGQLGNSMLPPQSSPVKVPALEDIAEISTYSSYTLALKNDGTVWGYGADNLYKFDNSKSKNLSIPKQISGLKDIKTIYAGTNAMFIDKNNSLWGMSYFGLDIGAGGVDLVARDTPVRLDNIKDIADIENGILLKKDGTVWQINSKVTSDTKGNTIRNFKLDIIKGLSDIKAIYSNTEINYEGRSFYAADKNNIIWDISCSSSSFKKQQMKLDYKSIKDIQGRLALKNDGTVLAWGNNQYGQAGNGDTGFISIPVEIKSK